MLCTISNRHKKDIRVWVQWMKFIGRKASLIWTHISKNSEVGATLIGIASISSFSWNCSRFGRLDYIELYITSHLSLGSNKLRRKIQVIRELKLTAFKLFGSNPAIIFFHYRAHTHHARTQSETRKEKLFVTCENFYCSVFSFQDHKN